MHRRSHQDCLSVAFLNAACQTVPECFKPFFCKGVEYNCNKMPDLHSMKSPKAFQVNSFIFCLILLLFHTFALQDLSLIPGNKHATQLSNVGVECEVNW